jgi:hypothetical protein
MGDLYVVQIVEDATGKVVRQSNPASHRRADKIEDGMNINLNHEAFHTRIVDASEAVTVEDS